MRPGVALEPENAWNMRREGGEYRVVAQCLCRDWRVLRASRRDDRAFPP